MLSSGEKDIALRQERDEWQKIAESRGDVARTVREKELRERAEAAEDALRRYKALAERFKTATEYWSLEAWENNMDFQDWRHQWLADYAAAKAK